MPTDLVVCFSSTCPIECMLRDHKDLIYWFSIGSSGPRTASGSIIVFSMDIEKERKEGGIEKGKVEALVLFHVAL